MSDRKWLTVREFRARHPNIGKNLLYMAIATGKLPSIRVGRKILLPSDAFDKLMEE